MKLDFYIQVLEDELRKRKQEQTEYSLRRYAYALQIDISLLVKVMKRKTELSVKSARGIAERLSLDPVSRETFLWSVACCNWLRYIKRNGLEIDDKTFLDQFQQTHSKRTVR